MFLSILSLGFLLLYVYLWGDYMKILVFFEVMSIIILSILIYYISLDFFSISYFLSLLIFLVCESSMGFMLFIFYISMESDVVKKLNLIQF